jgi:predicted Zn-dependent protease
LAAAGSALSMCGDQERAATFIEKALTLDPNNAWAWARHGWIAIYRGEAALAPDRFQRAMALSPMDPFAFAVRLGMGYALAKTGSLSQAVAIAREVIAAHPDIITSYRYLAAWSAMGGDLETARWAAQKLMAAQPSFTIERFRSLPIFRNTPGWADQVVEALIRAGLPER